VCWTTYPNMKNFLDHLATTDLSIQVRVVLRPHFDRIPPRYRLEINQQQVSGVLHSEIEFQGRVALLDPVNLEIQLLDKDYNDDHTTAVIVASVSIDGQELMPDFCHLAQYENDHGAEQATDHLGYNGLWRLVIDDCFDRWWHRQSGQGWLLEPT
jgi:hypothetical protein